MNHNLSEGGSMRRGRSVIRSWTRIRRRAGSSDQGFTLVELLVVVTILPLVIGAISVGLVSVLSLQTRVSHRISGSGDLQTIEATYVKDVESAKSITTEPSPPECGTGISGATQELGLVWSGGRTAVSYLSVPTNTGHTGAANDNFNYTLERVYCTTGNFTTPVSTSVISFDVSGTQSPPSICQTNYASCVSGPQPSQSTSDIASVSFAVVVPPDVTPYDMVASPRAASTINGGAPPPQGTVPGIYLFGTGCDVLDVGNGDLNINQNGVTDAGLLGLQSSCPGAATLANNGNINAAGILTPNPNYNQPGDSSISTGANPGNVPPQYGWTPPPDPFSGISPPINPGSGNPGSCKKTGSTYTCSPGYYATDPGFRNNSTIIFSGNGTYYFSQDFTLPNGSTTTFDTGSYMFGGSGSAFSTGTNSISITGDNALFYVPTGSLKFDNNAQVVLSPPPNYGGITIWDAGTCSTPTSSCTGGTVTLGNNGVNGSGNVFSGIYVPNGGVIDNNNGSITTAFIFAQWAQFLNGLVININSYSPLP
jgi:prepilin-type N-terminal cleavage/methylation domain-containing protein